jgi:adenylate cyclase
VIGIVKQKKPKKAAHYVRLTSLVRARWAEIVLPILLASFLVTFTHMGQGFITRLIEMNFDQYLRWSPRQFNENAPVTIIDIDDNSLEKIGQWPWSRLVLARLVDKITAAGGKSITFDIVFSEPDRLSPHAYRDNLPQTGDPKMVAAARAALDNLPDTDELFRQSIAASGRVVLGYPLVPDETLAPAVGVRSKIQIRLPGQSPTFDPGIAQHLSLFSGAVSPLTPLLDAAAGAAHFTQLGAEGLVRAVPLAAAFQGSDKKLVVLPALPLEAIRVALAPKGRIYGNWQDNPQDPQGLKSIQIQRMEPVPVQPDGSFLLYLSGHKPKERFVSAIDILEDRVDPARLKDKIILVGTSAPGLLDLRSTPLDSFIPGVELHAEAIEQILGKQFLVRGNAQRGKELVLILVLVVMSVLGQQVLRAALTAFIVFGSAAAWYFYSFYLYRTQLTLLDPVLPLMVGSVAYGVTLILGFIRAEREKAKLRGAFGLYLSPKLVDELANDPDRLKLGGEIRDMTVLFSDIRGFTSIAEQHDPQSLTRLINAFLTPMSAAVLDSRGTIDKYMGDAMMAFWNAPLEDPDHARNACLAALRMSASLGPLNQRLRYEAEQVGLNYRPLMAGIGINAGPCCVGNMGSDQRFAYSVLGDTVNLASRLESQTKNYGLGIIAGETTRDQAADLAWIEIDLLQVKGKSRPVAIMGLLGDTMMAANQDFQELVVRQQQFLKQYRAQQWDESARLLPEMVAIWQKLRPFLSDGYHPDVLSSLYRQRIDFFRQSPPGPDWAGAYIADEK